VVKERGQAIVELLLIAITFLFTILGVIQLALALNAYHLVRYAAYNAARAGVVHGGDLEKMQEAARISLLPVFPRHGRADHIRGLTENYLAATATDQLPVFSFFNDPITEVKILNKDDLSCGEVITFDDSSDAEKALLTIQVVHRYELVIPLVNRIVFQLYQAWHGGSSATSDSLDKLARDTHVKRTAGEYRDIEYRIPLVAHYTMRMQSDFATENCPISPMMANPPPPPPSTPVTTTTTTLACTRGGVFCGILTVQGTCAGHGWCVLPHGYVPPGCGICCPDGRCWDPPGDLIGEGCQAYWCNSVTPGGSCFCW